MNCLLFVPGTGFEPARPFEHHHLKVACLPISTPGLAGSKCKMTARPRQIYFKKLKDVKLITMQYCLQRVAYSFSLFLQHNPEGCALSQL